MESVKLVNSMSSDAGKIKGEIKGAQNRPPPQKHLNPLADAKLVSSLEEWMNLKMFIATWTWG